MGMRFGNLNRAHQHVPDVIFGQGKTYVIQPQNNVS